VKNLRHATICFAAIASVPAIAAIPLTPLPPQDGLKWSNCVTYYDEQAAATVNAAPYTTGQPKAVQVTTALPPSALPDADNWVTACR
jgi:hypothetical protein